MLKLRELRELRGHSLRKLAKLADIHYVSLIRLEAGQFDPHLSTLKKLAKALEVSVAELIGEVQTQPSNTRRSSHGTDQTKRRLVRRVPRRR
jgi:transcriptional regulator with XRE-family HTH domain